MWVEPGTWPASYSDSCRTSMTNGASGAGGEPRGERPDGQHDAGLGLAPATSPGVDAAVDVPDERVEPDAQRLAGQVVEVGGVLRGQDDRPVGFGHPAEPRPGRGAGRIDSEPGMCSAAWSRGERVSTMSGSRPRALSSPSPDRGGTSGTVPPSSGGPAWFSGRIRAK